MDIKDLCASLGYPQAAKAFQSPLTPPRNHRELDEFIAEHGYSMTAEQEAVHE